MDQNPETKPERVLIGANHEGAAPSRAKWLWAKLWIWTDRMLAALEEGVNTYVAEHGLLT